MNPVILGLLILGGVALAILIVVAIAVIRIKLALKSLGLGSFKDYIDDPINKQKSIASQTKLLTPTIKRDFPNFSPDEMFAKTELCLRSIFNSLEGKAVENKHELVLLSSKLREEVEDMHSTDTTVRYDDVKFHKHGISNYTRRDGVATVTVSTALEYYYSKTKNGKVIKDNTKAKKQDRIKSKFIYVYDPDKYSASQTLVGITCPNCGAPVKDLGNKVCRYCNSGLEDINLKSWYLISYESDY